MMLCRLILRQTSAAVSESKFARLLHGINQEEYTARTRRRWSAIKEVGRVIDYCELNGSFTGLGRSFNIKLTILGAIISVNGAVKELRERLCISELQHQADDESSSSHLTVSNSWRREERDKGSSEVSLHEAPQTGQSASRLRSPAREHKHGKWEVCEHSAVKISVPLPAFALCFYI
uniref:Uncharacterized protein n=1 Tax=Noccaea caerulescens TaxID=107243 RepID=A0A1J3CJQ1_NOCCA